MDQTPHTAASSHWRRLCAVSATLIAFALPTTPSALGAGDPVAKGSFRLQLSNAFRKQLKRNRVQMKPIVFSVKSGSIDPITGTGNLTLKGKLRFKHDGERVVYDKLTARLGSKGVLKGDGVKLFKLSGGSVTRNGFGVEIRGLRVIFLKSAARKINKKLDLNSLHGARAGKVTVTGQPQTVEVTGGNVHVTPNPTLTEGAGTVASKLFPHCVNGLSGVSVIAPGIPSGPVFAPEYDFPVSGGTISPEGTDGEVDSAGGVKLANNHASSPGGDDCDQPAAWPPLADLQQTDSSYNLLKNYVSSRIVISGAVPTAGDRGVGIGANIDPSGATVSADPRDHTVTINGLVVRFNGGSALYLNSTFLQPSTTYDSALQFASGDLFGTVNLTVTTR